MNTALRAIWGMDLLLLTNLPQATLPFAKCQAHRHGAAYPPRHNKENEGTMSETLHRTDTWFIGAGLPGIGPALELLDRGQRVLLLGAGPPAACGGQATDAFAGMRPSEPPDQRRKASQESPEPC